MKQRLLMGLLVLMLLIVSGCGQQPTTTSDSHSSGENAPASSDVDTVENSSSSSDETEASADESQPSGDADSSAQESVKIGLSWVPNTTHTGLYVAQHEGYYAEQGITAEILEAYEGGSIEQLVATGRLEFGVSYQEMVTQARANDIPIVSVAAIIQHNDSGFASRAEAGITRPADFAGKKYGAFGAPEIETAVLQGLMECDGGGDVEQVAFVDIGTSDFFVSTERGDIDFAWVFQAWTGIEAQKRGVDLNMVMINDLDCIPDYYTPVIITSERMIAERPETVQKVIHAVSKGYAYAIANPESAADMLLSLVPEMDAEIVQMSQVYLADKYQAEASRWGEQKLDIWHNYAEWMFERQLIPEMIDAELAFSNEFLP